MLGLVSMTRTTLRNRNAIEPHLKQKLSDRLHSLDNFFATKSIDFTFVKARNISNIKRDVVYCKNLSGLIKYVKDKHKEQLVHLKFGIDGGGGFLKLCLSIQSIKDDSRTEHSRQMEPLQRNSSIPVLRNFLS